jgi:hypothetical protein
LRAISVLKMRYRAQMFIQFGKLVFSIFLFRKTPLRASDLAGFCRAWQRGGLKFSPPFLGRMEGGSI